MTNETLYNELNKQLKSFSKLYKMVEGCLGQERITNLIKLSIIEQMQKIQEKSIKELKEENK